MKLVISINLDNDAFQPDPAQEISRILMLLAARFNVAPWPESIMDKNGNNVGGIVVEDNES